MRTTSANKNAASKTLYAATNAYARPNEGASFEIRNFCAHLDGVKCFVPILYQNFYKQQFRQVKYESFNQIICQVNQSIFKASTRRRLLRSMRSLRCSFMFASFDAFASKNPRRQRASSLWARRVLWRGVRLVVVIKYSQESRITESFCSRKRYDARINARFTNLPNNLVAVRSTSRCLVAILLSCNFQCL